MLIVSVVRSEYVLQVSHVEGYKMYNRYDGKQMVTLGLDPFIILLDVLEGIFPIFYQKA